MAVSALTTALSCALGSLAALLFFLHLRGDPSGMPVDGAAGFLAADRTLPIPAALTLLALVPATASATAALVLRPRDPHPPAPGTPRVQRRLVADGRAAGRETSGAYGRFGTRLRLRPGPARPTAVPEANGTRPGPDRTDEPEPTAARTDRASVLIHPPGTRPRPGTADTTTAPAPEGTPDQPDEPGSPTAPADWAGALRDPLTAPAGLPWAVALLAVGLAMEAYTERSGPGPAPAGVLAGWTVTALGLVLAAPGLTHLCGRLLQSAAPGPVRLLAGRILMEEAGRIGRPLGVVCAVASAAYAMAARQDHSTPALGPLTVLGTLLVAGCAVTTLLTAAVEARQARAHVTAALVRLGAPSTTLRTAAALRAGALLGVFAPLTLLIADLAAMPLSR
jgi:hypothetical protein